MKNTQTTKTATACQKTPTISDGAKVFDLMRQGKHSAQTSIKWAQIAGERQGTIESLQGENDMLRNHAQALAEALRWISNDCLSYNEAVTRARAALARWEAK